MSGLPPHDLAAEEAVLGALLLGPMGGVDPWQAVGDVRLDVEDFYPPKHQHIFDALLKLYVSDIRPDVIVVADELRRVGLLEAVGGVGYLHQLQNATPPISNIGAHAALVVATARRRRLILVANDLTKGASLDDETMITQAIGTLTAIGARGPMPTVDPSWLPIDLAAVLAGELVQPVPTVLHRDDGRALFYAAMVNGLHGDSGIGKGWIICQAIADELAEGGIALLVDLEDIAESVVSRLHDLGVSNALIVDQLVYVRPQTPFDDDAIAEVLRVVAERRVTVAVVDSLGEAFGLEGINEDKDAEVGPWMRRVARAIAEAGPCVILVDHSTKAADNPLHPSGSKRKRAAIGGASYLVEATSPLVKGRGGRLRLTCAKDRHGNYARGDVVANFVMKCDGERLDVSIYTPDLAPDVGGELPAILAAREIVRIVQEATEPISKRAVVGLVKAKASTDMKWAGLALAVDTGALDVDIGPRGAHLLKYAHDLDPDIGK